MKKNRWTLVAVLVVASPIIVAVVASVTGARWFPAGDMAQAELHMRGFFRHPPLVGAAGRIVSDAGFQGSHPGPSPWVAMLPVYLLGARSSAALLAAAASVHVASIAAILFLARRRGGNVLMWTMGLGLLAVIRSAGTDFMIEPWNPWLALLPFIVFMFLIVDVLDPSNDAAESESPGRADRFGTWHLMAAIAVGSHCLQCHAGYALLVVPPLVIALVVVIRRSSAAVSDRSISSRCCGILRPFALATGATLLLWLPPLVDQFRREPGNITILLQHFASPDEATLGFSASWRIVSSQLNVVGPWLMGPGAVHSSTLRLLGFVVFAIVVALAFVLSHRSALRSHTVFLGTLIGFMILGAFSILRIFGPYYEYTVRWLWMIGATAMAVSASALVRVVGLTKWKPLPARAYGFLAACVLITFSGVSIAQAVDRVKLPGATDSRILAGLIDDTVGALDRDVVYQVRFYDPYTLNATGFGLVLELERRGFDVKVDPEFAAAALPHRTAPMEATDEVLWVVVGPAVEKALSDPNLALVASFNPRSTSEQKRSSELLDEVRSGLRAAGRDDLVASLEQPGASILFADPPLPETTAELVRELISMGQPTGVFMMAVGDVAESLG